MLEIAFMGANYVARQVNWQMTDGWDQGEEATSAYFRPLATFADRFDELIAKVAGMGFRLFDLWTAQLSWEWATEQHLAAAREVLARHRIGVASYAGFYGTTPDEFERACRVAKGVGTRILGGVSPLYASDPGAVIDTLNRMDLVYAIENHMQRTPAEVLALIGDGAQGRVGTALDTGWWGTQGYDPVAAIRELSRHLVHLHLKDVRAAGGHETCRYGLGVVPVRECLAAARELGYLGTLTVEHEPPDFDPTDDCVANRAMLQTWQADMNREPA